jgi:hypothetical protein
LIREEVVVIILFTEVALFHQKFKVFKLNLFMKEMVAVLQKVAPIYTQRNQQRANSAYYV